MGRNKTDGLRNECLCKMTELASALQKHIAPQRIIGAVTDEKIRHLKNICADYIEAADNFLAKRGA